MAIQLTWDLRCIGRLFEFEDTGTAHDSHPFVPRSGSLRFLELGLHVVAVVLAFVREDTASVLARSNNSVGRELGVAVVGDFASKTQVARFSGGSVLSSEIAVLNGGGKLPRIAQCVSLWRTSEFGGPGSVESFACEDGAGG